MFQWPARASSDWFSFSGGWRYQTKTLNFWNREGVCDSSTNSPVLTNTVASWIKICPTGRSAGKHYIVANQRAPRRELRIWLESSLLLRWLALGANRRRHRLHAPGGFSQRGAAALELVIDLATGQTIMEAPGSRGCSCLFTVAQSIILQRANGKSGVGRSIIDGWSFIGAQAHAEAS